MLLRILRRSIILTPFVSGSATMFDQRHLMKKRTFYEGEAIIVERSAKGRK
jgi:hypothetical protein